jgi:DNA-binding CsgD family transcriptional regulator
MTLDIIGREQELETLARFVASTDRLPAAVMLRGDAGIGKSTLWRAVIADATARRYRVVSARPAGSEVRLSYSGVGDLFDGCIDEVLPGLPEPQRRALEIALLRTDAATRPVDQRAVAAGVLNAIRALSADRPLLIAIDDAPWLDAPSADALAYALRRLRSEPVAIILASRSSAPPGASLDLDRAFDDGRFVRLELSPMSFGAVHVLLRERTGRTFSRPTLRRIHATSGGNPFYALELARALDASGPRISEPIPIPERLDELLRERLDALSQPTLDVLFLTAATAQPSLPMLDAVMHRSAAPLLDPAVEAGIVRVDDGDIRFTHPLLAAAAYARGSGDRRRWHARLAEVATDTEQRARHQALAVDGPDATVASTLMDAGRQARDRGAPTAAAELFEAALERTPPDDQHRKATRAVESVPTLILVGERAKARTLLEAALPEIAPGPDRADALVLLADLVEDDVDGDRLEFEILDEAWRQSGADPARQAAVLLKREMLERSADRSAISLELARQALALADRAGDAMLLAKALTRTADLEVLHGLGGDPVTRFQRAIDAASKVRLAPGEGPQAMLAVCLVRAGRVAEARPLLEGERQRALDRGDESSHDQLCIFLTELEWLAGDFDRAIAYGREGFEVAEQAGSRVMAGAILGPLALAEGTRGDIDEARALAVRGAQMCDDVGEFAYAVYNRQVLGALELSLGDAEAAHRHLAGFSVERGVEGPKRIAFVGDEIEALIRMQQVAPALELIDVLERRGRKLGRPTLIAVAARCRALAMAATGDGSVPESMLGDAITTFGELGLPIERARTLLVLGEVRRRAKQKRLAREALDAALASFEAIGARIWADRVRGELARIGGRVATGTLTTTESRVAELVATGRSNKEVAAALFVSVKAVEANLSRIYAKLGVTSRTALARRLAGDLDDDTRSA